MSNLKDRRKARGLVSPDVLREVDLLRRRSDYAGTLIGAVTFVCALIVLLAKLFGWLSWFSVLLSVIGVLVATLLVRFVLFRRGR